MFGWGQKLFRLIKSWFKGKSSEISNQHFKWSKNPQSDVAQEEKTTGEKLFFIEKTQSRMGVSRHSTPVSEKRSRFNIAAETRPQVCHICRTKGKVTRLKNGKLRCMACEYTW